MIGERGLRLRPLFGACLAAFSLSACLGGTGTDTENGLEISISARVVDSSGTPVSGVTLAVHDATARVDSGIQNPLLDSTVEIVSDSNGKVHFSLQKAGLYTVAGKVGDSVVFVDTVRALGKPSGVSLPGVGGPQFKVERPIRAAGKVRLLSGYSPDSGMAMVRGTKIQSALDTGGSYMLGWLPPSAEKFPLAVGYGNKAAETRFVKVVAEGSGWSIRRTAGLERCMSDSTTATTSGNLSATSLEGAAGKACVGRRGTVVRILQTDSSGSVLGTLGDYVIPDPAASLGDSTSIPKACVRPGIPGTSRATLNLTTGIISVDDIIRGHGCPN
jgi:hypothetical protein